MNHYTAFAANVLSYSLNIDNEKIKNFCINYKKVNDDKGRKHSNRGGYQSKLIWGNNLSKLKELYELFDHTLYNCNNFFKSYANTNKYELYLDGAWLNVNPKNSYNSEHLHPHAYYSCVYYVCCDDKSGKIRFFHPCQFFEYDWKISYIQKENANKLFEFSENVWFKAENKQLLIFPSWLKHSVDRNDSDIDRISIAMNICVKEKNEINKL